MIVKAIAIIVLAYLIGAIPSGLIVVKIANGKDVRMVESGRTGGTNAMRAAGWFAGVMTGALDIVKGVSSGWIVSWIMPGNAWMQVLAALFVIIGHNYSIFLAERGEDGKLRLRGGAGGASCFGGAIALYPLSGLIIFPLSAAIFIFVGYASLTTMSVAFLATVVFIVRAITGASPWAYVVYGVGAQLLLVWALRPNIKRLANGTERLVGLRARLKKIRLERKSLESVKENS